MRKLMWFAIGFGGACAFGTYFWLGKWALLLTFLGLLAVVSMIIAGGGKAGRQVRAACLGISLGIGWVFVYDLCYTQPLRELDGQTVDMELTTCTDSWETDYGSAVDCYLDLEGKRYKVRLYLNDPQEIEPWTKIDSAVLVRLTTDGGYGEPTYHRSNGILALCYQREEARFSLQDDSAVSMVVIAQCALRRKLQGIMDDAFPGDSAAFAKALLLGDRTDLTYEQSTCFKLSGISHIVAVSGLHMSILFALVYVITMKRRYLLALFGIPAVVAFMAVACFTPSVTRAGIMQILMILALCLNREYDPPTALSFSALVMLILNPMVSSSVGFQLSVGSVAGIFLFYQPIYSWLLERLPEKKNRIWKGLRNWFASSVAVSLAAQLITTPLVAVYYGTVSLIGMVTNLAVLWIVTFIFYGVMLVCLIGLFSIYWAKIAAWVVAWAIRFVLGAARIFASMPLAAVYTNSIYIVVWLLMCYGMIFALILGRGKRPLISCCIAALGLSAALFLSWLEPLLTDARVTVLDVGQGQCVILQNRTRTYVVDCGGDYEADAADCCAQTLLSMGIRRIDGLIVTHYDNDHAGGVKNLLSQIDTGVLYLNPVVEDRAQVDEIIAASGHAQVQWVETDIQVKSEGMEITLFAPESAASGNESSIAVLFQTEKCDTLITGDRSSNAERTLLKRTHLPKLEVLVVGHHGSASSTSSQLLDVTKPEVAIISVGENNRYNHPAAEVLDRLKAAGCAIYRTDESGDIVYRR